MMLQYSFPNHRGISGPAYHSAEGTSGRLHTWRTNEYCVSVPLILVPELLCNVIIPPGP